MDDYPEWHRGRREYAVWIIELEREEIIEQVEAARKHLSGFLLDPYQRQPHITLFVCGFLADDPCYGDDYCRHQFEIHRQLLTDPGISPFSVEIGGLNSFAAAPFLEVRDREGGIERVRALLSSTATEIEGSTFKPHVTVGLYSGTFPSKMVCERIATFSPKPVSLVVKQITFAAYRASEISGPLVYKHRAVLSKSDTRDPVSGSISASGRSR